MSAPVLVSRAPSLERPGGLDVTLVPVINGEAVGAVLRLTPAEARAVAIGLYNEGVIAGGLLGRTVDLVADVDGLLYAVG